MDRRADIWAFGVVLFEMLFREMVRLKAKPSPIRWRNILEREPQWQAVTTRYAAKHSESLFSVASPKNPKDRLQAIGDARILLEELIRESTRRRG